MDSSKNTEKLITYFLTFGLVLGLIFIYFAQERLYNEVNFGEIALGKEKYIRSISVLFLFTAIIMNFSNIRKYYSTKFFIAYFLILGFVTINFIVTGIGVEIDNITAIMDMRGIGPWLALGLIFISYSDKRFELFKKFLILSVLVISVYSISNFIQFGFGDYRGQSLSKYRIYATNLIWISPFVFLILKNNKKLAFIRIFAICIGISTALITLTRSFLLIYFLVLLFDFFHSKKKIYYIIGSLIAGLVFMYILLNTETFTTSLQLLEQRATHDSRSSQISQFLSQINFFDIVVGKGFDALWLFDGEPYAYLDNQWLLFLWWAGLIPAIMYFYITAIIPFKVFISKRVDYETRVEAFILVIWTLSCAGLSIYSTMSVNFYFFIVCIIQGRVLYKYSKNEY